MYIVFSFSMIAWNNECEKLCQWKCNSWILNSIKVFVTGADNPGCVQRAGIALQWHKLKLSVNNKTNSVFHQSQFKLDRLVLTF